MRYVTWVLLMSLLCFGAACSNDTNTIKKDTETPSTTPPPDADNTARNADTQGLGGVTAQSESEADIQISAAVRKAVVDDKALSVNAHNVKITTNGGVVTLRGPVKSDGEKSSIESKAKAVAGVSRVDNLLEVEKNP